MKRATLVFPLLAGDRPTVLLGEKQRGFGVGKWNGFGGKMAPGEAPRDAAVRELLEECSLRASPEDLLPAGHLVYLFPEAQEWDHDVQVFVLERWSGKPEASEEMHPRWFAVDELPFGTMWSDDPHWLPLVLAGAVVEARFVFASDNERVESSSVRRLGFWRAERAPT
ncbi:MAG: 8-oxo-dGTP diphosphatase [Candidatus Bipolaricaulota bacterium]